MRLRLVEAAAADPAAQAPPGPHPSVPQAIAAMLARYDEHLTLGELAAELFVSPFYFSRVFARATGISPGRFLTAVRLFEAKRRLLSTSDTVADVVSAVGYSSVGTFTNRFTRIVGVPPARYRHSVSDHDLVALGPGMCSLPPVASLSSTAGDGPAVRVVLPPGVEAARLVVALFHDTAAQGAPVAFATAPEARDGDVLALTDVPDGQWVLVAVAAHEPCADGRTYSTARTTNPRRMGPDMPAIPLRLRPPLPTDVPVAFTIATSRARAEETSAAA